MSIHIDPSIYNGVHGKNTTCCAESVETWPMLFETIRSKDSATSYVYICMYIYL